MDFFSKENEMMESYLVEWKFCENEFPFSLNYSYYRISKNGGLLLITRKFKNKEEIVLEAEEDLEKNIYIYQSDGKLLSKILISKNTAGIEFLNDDRILIVKKDGRYHIFNPDGNLHLTKKIPFGRFFRSDNFENGIEFIKSNGNSFLFFTKSKKIFFVYNLENPKRIKILKNQKKFDFENFDERSISYFSDFHGKKFEFYISCLKTGILKFTFFADMIHIPEKAFNLEICAKLSDNVIQCELSPSKNLIVLLTKNYNIHVINLLNEQTLTKYKLILEEREKETFEFLRWIGNIGVSICFKRNLKFLFNTIKNIFEKDFQSDFNNGKNRLFYSSETDGLRIISSEQITKNKKKRNLYKNILLRRLSKSYECVKGIIYETPGFRLYKSYKQYLKKLPSEYSEIINEPENLVIGIKEILEAIKFEMVPKKQKKLMKAVWYGKSFLSDGKIVKKDIIKKFCDHIKLWINVLDISKRSLSFFQFENILRYDLENFIDILINKNEFNLAFFICKIKKKKNLLKKIFLKYVEILLKKDLPEEKYSENIINTYKVLNETNFLESTVLIEAAEKAQKYDRKKVVSDLLKIKNPIILKIKTFLLVENYDKALNLALEENDSDTLYFIFDKIFNSDESDRKNKLFEFVINSENSFLVNHLFKFFEADNNPFLGNLLSSLKNPVDFFLKHQGILFNSFFFKQIISILDNVVGLCEGNKNNFLFLFKHLRNIVKDSEKNLKIDFKEKEIKQKIGKMNNYNNLLPFFEKNSDKYINDPKFSTDKDLKKHAYKLNLTNKDIFLNRLKFVLENIEIENVDNLLIYCNRHQKHIKVIQLKILFEKFNFQEIFFKIVEKLPFNKFYQECMVYLLFEEAARIALFNKDQNKFVDAFNSIQSNAVKQKLLILKKSIF